MATTLKTNQNMHIKIFKVINSGDCSLQSAILAERNAFVCVILSDQKYQHFVNVAQGGPRSGKEIGKNRSGGNFTVLNIALSRF